MRLLVCLLVLLVLHAGSASAQDEAPAQQAPPPAVTVVSVEATDVTPTMAFTGRIEAVDKVALIARVDGFLEAQPFIEGSIVQAGDLLFAIEKGPYEARLGEVDADIAAAQAELTLAQLEVDRQTTLVARQAAAQAVLDQATAFAGKAEAELLRAQASRARAELDLSYTDIKAPFTGRIGRSVVSVGDFLSPATGTLATLVSQDPMYVTFPITQRELLDVRRQAADAGFDESAVSVRARLADGTVYDEVGTLNFVDVQVNPGTDTVAVRAQLPNPNGTLIDQQLVTAMVEIARPEQALLVPQQATLVDQGGRFVLVVGDNDTVEQRPITVGRTVDGNFIVRDGLVQGERVIIEGIQRVRPGMVVDPALAAGS